MNDTKSAPFAHMVKTKKKKKIHVSPKSSQKAPILANYAKFADHFLIWTTRN